MPKGEVRPRARREVFQFSADLAGPQTKAVIEGIDAFVARSTEVVRSPVGDAPQGRQEDALTHFLVRRLHATVARNSLWRIGGVLQSKPIGEHKVAELEHSSTHILLHLAEVVGHGHATQQVLENAVELLTDFQTQARDLRRVDTFRLPSSHLSVSFLCVK